MSRLEIANSGLSTRSGALDLTIRQITLAAQEIAEGHFDVELSVNAKDEVGQLAKAFNLTVKKLADYQLHIDEISDALFSISEGDLTIQAKNQYLGQFAKLKTNLRAVLDHLNSMLIQINDSCHEVDDTSKSVSNVAQTLSQGTAEQASSIEELSAAISELSQQIRNNAQTAKLSRDKAEFAGKELQLSNSQMQKMTTAMNEITANFLRHPK